MRIARLLSLSSLAVSLLFVSAGCGKPKAVCENVSCSNNGRCVPTNGEAQCICNTTFVAKGLECVQASTEEVCANNPCQGSNGKVCQAVNGFPNCVCPGNSFETDAGCIPIGPCAPNPCTNPNQSTCTETNGAASCACNPGYAAIVDGGCDSDRVYDCSRQHADGGSDDSFEADECPSLAKSYDLASGLPQDHTIMPAGDADWVQILGAQDGQIIDVTVTNSNIQLYLDVYGPDGLTSYASDHRGTASAQLRFRASGQNPTYLRVKGFRASDTGSYTLTLSNIGVDDFANTTNNAISITSGGNFTGNIQYADDIDVVRASLGAGHTYQFTVGASTASNIPVDVFNSDGTTLRKSLYYASTSTRTHLAHSTGGGEVYLSAHGTSSAVTGSFDVAFADLGPDDHGDVTFDATAITPSTSAAAGTFDRAGDVDMFSFSAQAGHAYKFTCVENYFSSNYGCGISMYDSTGTLVGSIGGGSSVTTSLSAKAATTGTYYLSAYHWSTSSQGGTYTYQLEDIGGDDFGDTIATASPVTVGTAQTGVLEVANDKDVFSFSTTVDHIYQVSCTATPSYACYITVTDSNGTSLGYGDYTTPASFKAATSGTVYVTINANSTTGSYSFTVTDTGVDDHSNTATGATSLTGTANGNIQYQYDVDTFAINANTTSAYTVTCTSTAQYVCRMYVYSPSNSLIASSSYGPSTTVSFKPTQSGIYTVQVSALSSYLGTYTLNLTTANDDFGDSVSAASGITVGTAQSGGIQWSSDVDYFSFSTTASHIYKADCTSSNSSLCYMSIYDSNQSYVTGVSGSTASSVTFAPSAAGTYYASVSGSGSTGSVGTYSLTVSDIGTDDHSNTATNATPITTTAAVAGNIQYSNDSDYFGFTGTLNNVYTFTCTTTASNICRMRARNASGTILATANGGLSTNTMSFKATSAGSYTVEVYGYSGYTGTYSLSMSQTADDYGDTTAQATPIAFATAVNGGIQYASDIDVFSYTSTASRIYQVLCTSSSSSMCNFVVKDPTGFSVANGYASTSTSTSFKATVGGTFTVEVSGSGSTTGTYTLTVTETADDFGDTTATATNITAGAATANGRIDYGSDVDVFSFSGTGMHIYQFACNTSASYVCALNLKDGSGNVIASKSYSTSNSIVQTLPSTGTYYVEVYSSFSGTGAYTYQLQDLGADDYGDTAATASPIIVGAAPTNGIIQVSTDHDFFSFTPTQNAVYRVRCTSTNGSLCNLNVRNATGSSVGSAFSSTLSEVGFQALTTGTYTIDTYGSSATGSYTMQVIADDHGDSFTAATAITLGATVNGYIDASADQDWFSVTLQAGTTYTLTMGGTTRYVTGYASDGTTVVLTQSTISSRTYAPATTGTYYFKAQYYVGTGAYTIKVQ
ncbi:MAG: beta strand repeat-containing protein [Myxococcaceae bacterium]